MSLTARIAIVPSRRLDHVANALACGGLLAAAVTIAARWPGSLGAIVAALIVFGAGLAMRHRLDRAAAPFTMLVSDRAEIEIDSNDADAADATWRLFDATLSWPGFVVIALRSDAAAGEPRTPRVVPLLDRELPAPERRALRRFLTWSLRGGAGRGPATGERVGAR